MASATPGGAPGYDYDKEFGNNITHFAARTSQRLRGYTAPRPEVKGRTPFARFWQCNCVPAVRRGGICGSCHARRLVARMERSEIRGRGVAERIPDLRFAPSGLREMAFHPPPHRFRLHPLELRQLVSEPGELPLGVMAGIGAADFGGLFARDFADEVAD